MMISMLVTATSWAQTSVVTFNLNMENETVSEGGVYLGAGVIGGPTEHELTDPDGDGVYSVDVTMQNGTTGNYIFLNGNCPDWSCKENLQGLPCSDPANWNDRILPEINGDMTISTCFGQCSEDGSCQAPPPASAVTFRVDMSEYTGSYGAVNLNGGFNGWCGSCAEMTDDDADGVYELAIDLDNEMSYEYKFTLDGWSNQEEFTEGDPCTSTIDGFTNRALTTGTEAMTLDVVCYNSCSACSDDLPWSHDCNVDNCDSWTFGNGADIAGSPWQGIDLNFECSTAGPAGPYNQWAGGTGDFTAVPPMNSTTGSNGLLIVDSDLFGADANYSASWIENSWVQTAEPINCGATEFIRMSFQTRYRCWDNGSSDDSEKCLVEISRDGVNWPDISTFSEADGTVDYGDGVLVPSRWEVFPGYETGSETGNPSFIDLDISSAAGGQEQVWIRFRWSGTWGYSWEIDDIFLQEVPMNDMRVESYVSTTDYENTGMYELGAIPIGQLTNYQAGVTVKNIGINPQSGVQLNLSVDGTTIGTSPLYSLDYDTEETLQAAYALNGLGLGSHTLEFEVSSDAEDDYPENNSATRTIEITEHQLGRDNGSMTGLFPSDGYDDFIALNPFDIYADATIYAIDVAIAAGTESGTPVIAHLYDPSDESFLQEQYGGLMASSYQLDLDGTWTNEGDETEVTWYTLLLEDPVNVSAGQSIAAGFEHYGGSNVQIWESHFAFDQTSFTYGPFGSGQAYDWYYTNEVPMVRLNFNPDAVNSGAGCTDSQACNYNPNALEDNGSCEYETCAGCLDEMACNFDSEATISSPELCEYPGCLDSSATNYDPSAGCDGPCIYLTYDCASIGEPAWGNEAMGLYPEWQGAMHGVAWAGEWVFNVPLSIVEPSSGVTYSIHHVNWTSVDGLPAWLEEVDYTLGELAAESQHCIAASGTPSEPGWHEITSNVEVFISIFGQPFSIGEQSFSAWLEVAENPNPIPGCTYATAQNFVAFATLDDGSCEFAGCTDPEAGNFNPLATIDDGSCGEACDPSSNTICETDIDNDGTVSVSDLLLLLGDFGTTCIE